MHSIKNSLSLMEMFLHNRGYLIKEIFFYVLFLAGILTRSSGQEFRQNPASTTQPSAITVATQHGFIKGITDSSGIAIFMGIPYAAPPTGKRRWQPPMSPEKWNDILSATAYAAYCPQLSKDGNSNNNEDCLYLNVFTAANNIKDLPQKKPVMFWIHGGGFLGGSAKGYDSRVLAGKGVVVVTINYRLGALGYLCHPALQFSAASKGVGNYGLLDQIAALRWVKTDIVSFGGDPGNVTIWGESAGAFSVGALLASPIAKGLFHKAILESGTGLLNGIQTKAAATDSQPGLHPWVLCMAVAPGVFGKAAQITIILFPEFNIGLCMYDGVPAE